MEKTVLNIFQDRTNFYIFISTYQQTIYNFLLPSVWTNECSVVIYEDTRTELDSMILS